MGGESLVSDQETRRKDGIGDWISRLIGIMEMEQHASCMKHQVNSKQWNRCADKKVLGLNMDQHAQLFSLGF